MNGDVIYQDGKARERIGGRREITTFGSGYVNILHCQVGSPVVMSYRQSDVQVRVRGEVQAGDW